MASTSRSQPSTAPGIMRVKGFFALGGARVALEEEPFELPQFGTTKVGPHGGEVFGGIRR